MESNFHLKTYLFLCWFDIFSWFQLIIIVIVINGDKFTERISSKHCSLRICNWSKVYSCYLCFLPMLIVSWSILPPKKKIPQVVFSLSGEMTQSFIFSGIWALNAPIWVGLPSSSIHYYHWSWIHYNFFCRGAILIVLGSI